MATPGCAVTTRRMTRRTSVAERGRPPNHSPVTGPAATRVLVLAGHPWGTVPGQRFRFEQHVESLARQGIELELSSFFSPGASPRLYEPGGHLAKAGAVGRGAVARLGDILSARRYDVALVHKGATPIGYPVVERLLAEMHMPYVFDFDDAIYMPQTSGANRLAAPLKFARKAEVIARHADLVVAGNRHLAAWASHHSHNVRVIPTTIDTRAYQPPPRQDRSGQAVCIGWSGSVTTAQYLDMLAPVLRDLQTETGVRIKVIGAPDYRIRGRNGGRSEMAGGDRGGRPLGHRHRRHAAPGRRMGARQVRPEGAPVHGAGDSDRHVPCGGERGHRSRRRRTARRHKGGVARHAEEAGRRPAAPRGARPKR